MNTSASWIVLVVAAVWGGMSGCATSDPARSNEVATNGTPRVHVIFANPDTFTDARSSLGSRNDPRELDPLGRFLVREAGMRLPPGQRMTIVFHDVDLAGDFEPGGLSAMGDVRIMREMYPPRLVFTYSIVDATDTVIGEGTVTLANRDFLRELYAPAIQQEPLHHEKAMLRDWARKTLPVQRATPPQPAAADEAEAR